MWNLTPLDKVDSRDRRCLWKIKDGSRRCKGTIGSNNTAGRIGNRDELLAKVSSTGTLMRQEMIDLASGLCCLQWHSKEHIAQQICEMWANKLEDSKTSRKQHDSLAATIAPTQGHVTTERLKQALGNYKDADEIPADENKMPIPLSNFTRTTTLPRTTVRIPAIESQALPSTPERHTAYSKFDTLINRKRVDSPSSQDCGYFSSSTTPSPTLSAKKAYPASFICPRSSNSSSNVKDLLLLKDENEARDERFVIVSPEPSRPATPLSATPNFNSGTAQFIFVNTHIVLKRIDFFAPYKKTKQVKHATLLHTIERDLLHTEIARRTVYAFRTISSIPFIKIGMTKDLKKRISNHVKCGLVNRQMVFRADSQHGKRVEALIHRHFDKERRVEYVDHTNTACVHRQHIEWFDVSDERVKVVAEGWQKWIALGPYEETGNTWTLKNEWREKLNLVKINHEEQDVWLDWLNCVVPDFVCDPSAHLRHMPPSTTDLRENCVIDEEAEPEVKLKIGVKE